eukprot:6417154-Ditylum_brightwellii.AAC.1
MATQCCRQMLVQLSWPQNREMAPMMQGVCSMGKTTAGDIAPPPPTSMMHWEHHIGEEGGGGDVVGVFV